MKRQDFSDWPCSIARVSQVIGDGGTPLILRDAALGTDTFDGFQEGLGISRNTLTQRLNLLVEIGMLSKDPYSDRPVRYRYTLTDMGRSFVPVLLAMAGWGDEWLFGGQPPYRFRHKTCGHLVQGVVICRDCGEPLTLDAIEAPTPGEDGA